MSPSILSLINPDDINFLVKNFQYNRDNRYRFGELFPSRQISTLTWHAAEGQVNRHIAADVVSRGASIDTKKREGVSRISGDIPKIAISRIMDENDYYELQALLAQYRANNEGTNFIRMFADDYNFCYNGIMGRLEWLAMQSISRGKLSMTELNNNGIITEVPVDYQLDSEQKCGVDTPYSTGTSGKPFTVDFPEAIELAEERGFEINVIRMNRATWLKFAKQEEVINHCSTFLANLTSSQAIPTLTDVNNYLQSHSETYGDLRIEVVTSKSIFEDAYGKQTKTSNFADNVIGFYTDGEQGETNWVRPIDMDVADASIKSMSEIMMFKRFATEDPVIEKTMAIANAFPVWKQAPNCILSDISSNNWTLG